jgi:signal peptidase I
MANEQSARTVAGKTAASRHRKEAKEAPRERTLRDAIWEWTKSLAMGFVLFLVLRTFLIQTFTITSGSMENTLLVGDFLVLSKSAYGATIPGTSMKLPGYSHPKRGDVVVFRGHHEPIDLVKRLVGMPNDTLSMKGGVLYVDGVAQDEPYVRHMDPSGDGYHDWMKWQTGFLVDTVNVAAYRPTRDNWGPLVVPPAHYFMMGDNRDESLDSRYWGWVEPPAMKGRAVLLYFSYDRDAFGPLPFLSHVRWNRIFDRIR